MAHRGLGRGAGAQAGINLGPVYLSEVSDSQTNMVGDGINVAQRVMSFAEPGQLLVSRSFRDVAYWLSSEYDRLFVPEPSRPDKHGRTHELYSVTTSVRAGRRVAEGVRVLVVPGSQTVKREAERLGLDRVFRAAGAEWREAGCSMCIAMNGDRLAPGELAISTSKRNFEGRQGPGGRTRLASPLTAAASAVTGVVTDPRTLVPA